MWNGFIGNLIRRTNQRMMITAFLLLAGLVAFFGYNRSYFLGFFTGAHIVSGQQLTGAASTAAFANPFVTVTDERADPTNLQEEHESEGHEYVDGAFISALVGGQHMLVRVDPAKVSPTDASAIPATLTGQIKNLSSVESHLYGHYETPPGDLLPIYLDTHEYKEFGYISLAICVPILLLALWMLWRWWQASSDFSRHPICRKLASQGQLEILVQQIDSEMAAPHAVFARRGAKADVTQHWLVISQFMGGVAMQIPSIVWVHRSLVKRRIYFFITVSKRHLVNVYDQLGQKASIQLSDAQAGEFFEHLRSITPRAIHGFDKRLPSLWKRTPNKTGFPDAAGAMLSGQALPDQRVTNQYGG